MDRHDNKTRTLSLSKPRTMVDDVWWCSCECLCVAAVLRGAGVVVVVLACVFLPWELWDGYER